MTFSNLLRRFVFPKVVRLLKADIDAIAWRPVQVHAYMYSVLVSQAYKLLNFCYPLFIK